MDKYHATEDQSSPLLTMEDALNPDVIGSRLQTLGTITEIATGEKRELIDSYLVLCRSREEIKLLREEAQNVVSYYKTKKVAVQEEITNLSADLSSTVDKGAVALHYRLLNKVNTLLVQGMEVLKVMDAHGNEMVESTLDDDNIDSDESSDEDLQ